MPSGLAPLPTNPNKDVTMPYLRVPVLMIRRQCLRCWDWCFSTLTSFAVVVSPASRTEPAADLHGSFFYEFGNPLPSVGLLVLDPSAMAAHGDNRPVVRKVAVGF